MSNKKIPDVYKITEQTLLNCEFELIDNNPSIYERMLQDDKTIHVIFSSLDYPLVYLLNHDGIALTDLRYIKTSNQLNALIFALDCDYDDFDKAYTKR